MAKPKNMSDEEYRSKHAERERLRYHENKARKKREYESLSEEEKEKIKANRRQQSREWRRKNPERFKYHDDKKRAKPDYKEKRKAYLARPDVKARNQARMKTYNKQYNLNNKDRIAAHLKWRYHNDLNFRIKHLLRCRLRDALKENRKPVSAVKLLGCTIPELKAHLESQFESWMSWENFGEWQIDHIIPLSSFDLRNIEEASKACCWKNLQPLCRIENAVKGDNLNYVRST